jgi:arylsulfatase A-like enzyme
MIGRGVAVLALALIAPLALRAAGERPNVLLVITDQEAPALRLPPLDRPNLERLAARGRSFTRAYAAYPVCSPSRAALLTGLYPHQNGVVENVMAEADSPPLDPAIPNLGSVLAGAGYDTAWFGKWHLSPNERISEYGFAHSYVHPRGNHARESDPEVAARAVEWIRARPPGRPWFAVVSILNPHDIGMPERYADVELRPYPVELPASFGDDPTADGRAPELRAHAGARRENRTPTDPAAWTRYLRLYCHLLERIDPHLGLVLDAVAARGDDQRTLVVYTSDHGEMGGAHGMAQKRFLYEESVRVPLYVVDPMRGRGGIDARPASNVDVAPTIAAAVGVEWPTALPGRDLLAPAGAAGGELDHAVFAEVSIPSTRVRAERERLTRMIRTARWKYVLYPSGVEELYDTDADPAEVRDLARSAEHAERRAALRARLEAWSEATRERPARAVAGAVGR